jgi:CCR4-NOT transcriptional regulation complex NOT5 subunit
MAIISSVPSQIGIILDEAYVNVRHVSISKQEDKYRFSIVCDVYANKSSKEGGAVPVESKSYLTYDLPLDTLYPSIYAYLKTLEEYSNAQDD